MSWTMLSTAPTVPCLLPNLLLRLNAQDGWQESTEEETEAQVAEVLRPPSQQEAELQVGLGLSGFRSCLSPSAFAV